MTLRKTLTALVREIVAEADANAGFRDRLAAALGSEVKRPRKAGSARASAAAPNHKRPSNRRTPSIVDPVQLAREGEQVLRDALSKLDVEQLRDVVADYGMDPGKLVMKWRDEDRIVERIVEVARGRAQKGSAFRPHPEGGDTPPDDGRGREVPGRVDPELPIATDDAGGRRPD